jgi:hypothetical protein
MYLNIQNMPPGSNIRITDDTPPHLEINLNFQSYQLRDEWINENQNLLDSSFNWFTSSSDCDILIDFSLSQFLNSK